MDVHNKAHIKHTNLRRCTHAQTGIHIIIIATEAFLENPLHGAENTHELFFLRAFCFLNFKETAINRQGVLVSFTTHKYENEISFIHNSSDQ